MWCGHHDCNNSRIEVRNEQLSIPRIAVPGAAQHGTPG